MNTQRRSVVVGGAGFIGTNLVPALLARGDKVEVIDNLSGGSRDNLHDGAIFHQLDITDYEAIAPVISGADFVFHLAALPRVQFSIDFPLKTHEANVNGTLNVLHAAKVGGVGRVVYSGSSSAYGDQEVFPLHEAMREKPVHPYGLQKYMGEEYARIFADVYGLPTVTLRYFNVYGPKLDPKGAYASVIGIYLRNMQAGEKLPITGDGTQTRDFTHVSDVVRANILASESPHVGRGEVINVGGGKNYTIKELAAMFDGEVEHIPARKETQHSLADVSRAKALLGWEPKVDLADGVAQLLVEWKLR